MGRRSKHDFLVVDDEGGICDLYGGLVYEPDCLEGMSQHERWFIASYHTTYPGSEWLEAEQALKLAQYMHEMYGVPDSEE